MGEKLAKYELLFELTMIAAAIAFSIAAFID